MYWEDNMLVTIPMPIQIVIDDVGWWSGEDGSERQEPYRTGFIRNHVPADYQAIVDLGKKLGVRPQAATVLCEWDKSNILKKLPTSTWMGKNWDNSKWVGPWLEEAADIIQNNQNHYELTLHGVGHEYWNDKKFSRAEWADPSGTMRPLDQIELHLDFYAKLMDQHGLGPFPTSFVPAAFLHGFGVTGSHKISMAAVLQKRGINYINTPFDNMRNAEKVQFGLLGVDSGILTVDRGEDLFDWKVIGGKPRGTLTGPTCGMHWPNLLHEDPLRNSEIVDAWVDFLKPYNEQPETLLATDSEAFLKQLLHHVTTKVRVNRTTMDFDFKRNDSQLSEQPGDEMIIKVASGEKLAFNSETVKISSVKMDQKQEMNLYTLVLKLTTGSDGARLNFKIL
jgi:hypothetical protein